MGIVALVGAGPGDPELLTMKAHARLREAEVVIYDRLVNPAILDIAPPTAKLINVGKQAGGPSLAQEEINRILVQEALSGLKVVRLKGGDPNIFGRVQEEIAACQLVGLEVEIVPGISAAQAASASIKLPLTYRGQHRSITLLTAATKDQVVACDLAAFIKAGRPFAIYMGVKLADKIVEALRIVGADMSREVVIVENASLPGERVLAAPLNELGAIVRDAEIKGPAILFIGLSYAEMGLMEDERIERLAPSNVVPINRQAG